MTKFKKLLTVSSMLVGVAMMFPADSFAQDYRGLSISRDNPRLSAEPEAYPRGGIDPYVSQPVDRVMPRPGTARIAPDVQRPTTATEGNNRGTATIDATAAREARQAALEAERQARIDELNQIRDQQTINRAEYLSDRSAGTDNPGGMSLEERFTWNQDKMALLEAYKQRRSQELELRQQAYESMRQR